MLFRSVGGSGGSGPGGGQGPGGESGTGGMGGMSGDTMGSSTAQDAAANQAASEAAQNAASDQAAIGMQEAPAEEETGIMSSLANAAKQALNAYATFSPTAVALNAIATAISNSQRGVTPANDYSQATTSVQTSTPNTSSPGGGVASIQNYAPLYNTSTGDPVADTLRTRLNNLIQAQQPTVYGLPSINPYANYTLLDLYNLRRK